MQAGQTGGAARGGGALLSGLLRCGRCGRQMVVGYGGIGGRLPRYTCQGGRVDRGSAACQSLGAARVEEAVSEQLLEAVQPGAFEHRSRPLGIGLVAFAVDDSKKRATVDRAPERLEIQGIENAFRLSPRLYSGGDPHGPESFASLKSLGVRTIISVDGAAPDVEAARKLGLRYVHLPVGYDGVPREQAVRLVRSVRTLPGPVYVHCHHGKHRGPTAAAVCGMATEGWSREQALAWMKEAGTSPDYRGLFTSAREFVPPSADELERVGGELPERAKVPALVEMMVQVDERWDRLKAVQKAGLKAPADQPDLDPPHEALQLAELFRELVRLPEPKERGKEFLAAAEVAERRATGLVAALRSLSNGPTTEARELVESSFLAVGKGCTTCHASHRDN